MFGSSVRDKFDMTQDDCKIPLLRALRNFAGDSNAEVTWCYVDDVIASGDFRLSCASCNGRPSVAHAPCEITPAGATDVIDSWRRRVRQVATFDCHLLNPIMQYRRR